jgi:hypothetical protein
MLSIVICPVNPDYLSQIKTNIQATIGIPYEIIAIDNRKNPRGITQVYNEGTSKAKYDFICYVHEDVAFQTKDWGKNLLEAFENPNVGLVGVAGGAYKPSIPSGWGAQGHELLLIKINLIQHFKYKDKAPSLQFLNGKKERHSRVACVDGVFLATRKTVAMEFPFDESLTGFHGYDIDFSISVNTKYEVYVAFDILLEHFSEGGFNQDWFETILKVHDKWKGILPLNPINLTREQMIVVEKRSFRFMAKYCSTRVPFQTALRILKLSVLKELDYLTYLKMYYSLVKAYLKKKEVSF